MSVQHFRYLLWHGLVAVIQSRSIHNFVIHETQSGTLLEYVPLNDALNIYDEKKNETSPPVTVALLTNRPLQNFDELQFVLPVEKETVQIRYFNDRRLRTAQLHVLIEPTHSVTLPGLVKFMVPLNNMNSTDIAKFVKLSMDIERHIVSPNIDNVLCFPHQQLILMNTILGNYQSFTMYVVNWDEAKNAEEYFTDEPNDRDGMKTGVYTDRMTKRTAKELLNPINCDSAK